MKLETYKYQEGEVNLTFQFEINEKLEENKKIFITLLEKAITELKENLT